MSADEWKPRYNPWLIAVAVMAGTFMEVLDTSIANVCLPHIAGSLSATIEEATWMVTSYLVANAIVLPLTGWISARWGRKNFLMTCIVAFTIASGLSGAAQSLEQLVFFRILQGLGGGAMQPVAMAVLLESFPPAKRGMAIAFYGVGVVVAPILGPIIGGWLADNYNWRWAFYINLPVGAVAALMAWVFVEDPPYLKTGGGKADLMGFLFLAFWISALQIMLDKGQLEDWFDSSLIVGLAVAFVVFLILFLIRELRVREPVVDLSVFRDSTYALSTFMITIVGAVLYGTLTLGPFFMQELLGYPAYEAGLAVAPRGLGALLAMVVAGPLLAWIDGRLFVALGFFLLGVSNQMLSHNTLLVGMEHFVWPNIVSGFGIGFVFVPLTTIANDRLPLEKLSSASGVFNLMRNLGGGVGIAMSTTLLSRGNQFFHNQLVSHINPYNPAYQEYLSRLQPTLGEQGTVAAVYGIMQRNAALLAYADTYTIIAYVCFACIPLVLLLRKPRKGAAGPPVH